MLKDEVGTARLEDITDEQSKQVIDMLQEYVRFACKCQKGRKE